jgi:hypothetical protein
MSDRIQVKDDQGTLRNGVVGKNGRVVLYLTMAVIADCLVKLWIPCSQISRGTKTTGFVLF